VNVTIVKLFADRVWRFLSSWWFSITTCCLLSFLLACSTNLFAQGNSTTSDISTAPNGVRSVDLVPGFGCGVRNLRLVPSGDATTFDLSFQVGTSSLDPTKGEAYVIVSAAPYSSNLLIGGFDPLAVSRKLLPPPQGPFSEVVVSDDSGTANVSLLMAFGALSPSYSIRGFLPGVRYQILVSSPLLPPYDSSPGSCLTEIDVVLPYDAVCGKDCSLAQLAFDPSLATCVYPCLGSSSGGVCGGSAASGLYQSDDIDFSQSISPHLALSTAAAVVQLENKILTRDIPITGSPVRLHFTSDRQLGRVLSRAVTIPLTDTTLPSGLSRIVVKIGVAGQSYGTTITTGITPSMTYPFAWDGKNASGNVVTGVQTLSATVELWNGTTTRLSSKSYQMRVSNETLSSTFAPAVGGWTLSPHHVYQNCTLYLGTGAKLKVTGVNPAFLGTDAVVPSTDGKELYVFSNATGLHTRTVNATTGTTISTFTYDTNKRLTAITDAFGNRLSLSRSTSGVPLRLTAPFGQVTTLTTDANGYLTSVGNPAGEAYTLTHVGNGLLSRFATPSLGATTYLWDALGGVASEKNALSFTTTFDKQVTLNLSAGLRASKATQKSPLGRVTTVSEQDVLGTRTRESRDPAGIKTTHIYDPYSTYTLHPDGTSLTETLLNDPRFGSDVRFVETSEVKVPSGKKLTTTVKKSVAPRWNSFANPLNELLRTTTLTVDTTVNGRTSKFTQDFVGKKSTARSPLGVTQTTFYDQYERVVREERAGFTPLSFTYDVKGRLSQATQGSRTSSTAYTSQGYVDRVADAAGRVTSYTYDLAGRVTSKVLPGNRTISYTYDKNGNLISLTPPQKTAHLFAYNALDTVTQTVFSYNGDQQLLSIDPPTGKITNTYSSAGQLTRIATELGSSVSYAYNPITGKVAITDALHGGRTEKMLFTYDGSLLTKLEYQGLTKGSLAYSYNGDLRVSKETINGVTASDVAYTYNNDGQLIKAGALSLVYSPTTGQLTQKKIADITFSYIYNTFGEVTSYSVTKGVCPTSCTTLFAQTFVRDQLGRITENRETLEGVTTTYQYSYDLAGRLTSVKKNGSTQAAATYDANGNRTSLTRGGATTTAAYDAQDRLTSSTLTGSTYKYNASGALQQRTKGSAVDKFTYDEFGTLTSVALAGGTTTLVYGADGEHRRVARLRNGVMTSGWLYDEGDQIVAEVDSTGALVKRFVYASSSNLPDYFLQVQNSGTTAITTPYVIIPDHVGSPRIVVSTSGGVVQRLDFDEWGTITRDTKPGLQPFGFAGGLYDLDTKLVRFGARDYDSALGRWLDKDPLGFDGGDTNLYGYVLQDPVNLRDPKGTIVETAWDAFNVALDATSLATNVASGNVAGAAVDAASLAVDVAATVLPGVPGGAGSAVKAARTAEKLRDGERMAALHKSAMRGQEVHKQYRAGEVVHGVTEKEFRIPNTRLRVDFVDFEKAIVYELKPSNPRAIARGKLQAEKYISALKKQLPEESHKNWTYIIDTY
jgi:RHS repeat-associated protein